MEVVTSSSEAAKEIVDVPMQPVESATTTEATENRLLLADEQKMINIEHPHHHDVLLGRGVTTNRHPGNASFRALVGLNKEQYITSTKRQKMAISRSIVEAVRSLDPPGRFLDKSPETGLWFDVGHKRAVEKTSQALRDGAALLRKQLSADMGDPEFLNSVFNEENPEDGQEGQDEKKGSVKGTGKENSTNKGKSPEKAKPIKAKSSSIKKGHRRVRSNPSSLSAAVANAARRERFEEEPLDDSSRHHPSPHYSRFPPLPHSPIPPHHHPRHARSLPNSPMTWGGPPPPYAEGPYPHHSPYQYPSPSSFSPYGKPSSHAPYGRSHSFDYHPHGPPPPTPDAGSSPRHRSWSPYGSHPPPPYHHPHHGYHHRPPPPLRHPTSPPPPGERTSSPPPPQQHATSSGVPMPTVRRTPPRYYAKHGPIPEWSPRRVNHTPYHSPPPPYSPYSPHGREYTPGRSASWTPRSASPHYHHGHYSRHHDSSDEHGDDSGGLSVPSLGGEPRGSDTGRFSPKVHLNPRIRGIPTWSNKETPPRPPPYMRQDFNPPLSPTLRRSKSKEERQLKCSTVMEEEKKSAEPAEEKAEKKEAAVVPYPSVTKVSRPTIKSDPTMGLEPVVEMEGMNASEELQQRDSSEEDEKMDSTELRASPCFFLSIDENGNVEASMSQDDDDNKSEPEQVGDIAMSPLPYDHEDPVSLMDLPANLLCLPISPCGPNDDPLESI